MASEAKRLANRRNSAGSTGPNTASGKRRVRLNAWKNGLFATELLIAEEENSDFQQLRSTIYEQINPATPLQHIAFEQIVSCYWRRKLAMRVEMQQVKALLDLKNQHNCAPEQTDEQPQPSRSYGASRTDLRRGIQFLLDLRQDIQKNGGIHLEQWREPLVKVCGEEFFRSLTTWAVTKIDAIRLADMLLTHAELYNRPLPPDMAKAAEDKRVIVDPNLSWQLAVKLLDEKIQHFRDLAHAGEIGYGAGGQPQSPPVVDFAPRYFTTASRDLERAVSWYLELKEVKL